MVVCNSELTLFCSTSLHTKTYYILNTQLPTLKWKYVPNINLKGRAKNRKKQKFFQQMRFLFETILFCLHGSVNRDNSVAVFQDIAVCLISLAGLRTHPPNFYSSSTQFFTWPCILSLTCLLWPQTLNHQHNYNAHSPQSYPVCNSTTQWAHHIKLISLWYDYATNNVNLILKQHRIESWECSSQ